MAGKIERAVGPSSISKIRRRFVRIVWMQSDAFPDIRAENTAKTLGFMRCSSRGHDDPPFVRKQRVAKAWFVESE